MADDHLIKDAATWRQLERLQDTPLNFDLDNLEHHRAEWNHDERVQPLLSERPGPPEPDGPFDIARRLMQGYEFADPSLVRAYYDPDVPLLGRNLLLEISFHGLLRFRAGCRIVDVYEREQEVHGRPAHVWGWNYRTLKGHFEKGEMHWQVFKRPDTGEVAFRLEAWHRRATDVNPIIRLGYGMFGRREQVHFYDSTCERMRRLTQEAVAGGRSAAAVRAVAAEITARPSQGDDAPHDQLAHNIDVGSAGRQ